MVTIALTCGLATAVHMTMKGPAMADPRLRQTLEALRLKTVHEEHGVMLGSNYFNSHAAPEEGDIVYPILEDFGDRRICK